VRTTLEVKDTDFVVRELTEKELSDYKAAVEVADEAEAAMIRAFNFKKKFEALMILFWDNLADTDERLQATQLQEDKCMGIRLAKDNKTVVILQAMDSNADNQMPPQLRALLGL
jgi:hypothetical protein